MGGRGMRKIILDGCIPYCDCNNKPTISSEPSKELIKKTRKMIHREIAKQAKK
jgi:hypothetical protein